MKTRTTLSLFAFLLCACTLSQDSDAPFGSGTEASGSEGGDSSTTAPDDDRPDPSPPRSAVTEVCERIDECGFLPPGVRLSDCEDTTQMCLQGGLQSERSDWELFAMECLELENCFNFLECYEGLQTCEIPVDVGTTGGFGGWETSGGLLGTTTDGLETSTSSFPEPGTTTTGGEGGGDTSGGGGVEPPICGGSCEACIDCAFDEPCAPQANACAANPSCLDLNDCYADCFDADCYDLCDVIYPEGVADYEVLTGCILDECASC